ATRLMFLKWTHILAPVPCWKADQVWLSVLPTRRAVRVLPTRLPSWVSHTVRAFTDFGGFVQIAVTEFHPLRPSMRMHT
ncbi:MAG TPA: hypothetical protein VK545_15015, partial [Streptomyces sp.]|nr:hypothetical protein [Streptomyces sp.]